MIQTLLLFSEKRDPTDDGPTSLQRTLTDAGLELLPFDRVPAGERGAKADAVLLAVPASRISVCLEKPELSMGLPRLWCCDSSDPATAPDVIGGMDGILFPGMSPAQIRWSLVHAVCRYRRRSRLEREQARLLRQLEERRRIDQAKAILCEARNLTEAEAYGLLRKQAMDERRRIADLAADLVRMHRLLKNPKERRRSR